MYTNIWTNKAQCEEAERLYYEKLSGAKKSTDSNSPAPGSIAEQISKARQHIKNSLEAVEHVGQDKQLQAKFEKLQLENRDLRKATEDLKNLVICLTDRVNSLEGTLWEDTLCLWELVQHLLHHVAILEEPVFPGDDVLMDTGKVQVELAKPFISPQKLR